MATEATDAPQNPEQTSKGPQTPETPHAPSGGSPETQDEAATADASAPDRRSARQKVADLLWWSVPGSTDEEAKQRANEMLDELVAEARAQAAADVHRGELPTFPADETPELVAKTVRAVDVRLAAQGPDAPYGVEAPANVTLPAWLYQRFAVIHGCPPWDRITDSDHAYWEHQAAAVRRAVARGGFKTTEEPAR